MKIHCRNRYVLMIIILRLDSILDLMIDFLEIVHILLFLSLEISMNFLEIVLLILNEFITG